jgi:hypothetical protein
MPEAGVPIERFAEIQFEAMVELVARFKTDEHRADFIGRMRDRFGDEAALQLRAAVWKYMQDNGLVPKQEALFAA